MPVTGTTSSVGRLALVPGLSRLTMMSRRHGHALTASWTWPADGVRDVSGQHAVKR